MVEDDIVQKFDAKGFTGKGLYDYGKQINEIF